MSRVHPVGASYGIKELPQVGVQGKEGAPGEASPFRGRGGDSRWFFPFTCLKIKNSSPDVSCASGPICLDNRVSSRSVEINKHRETTSKDRRRARGRAGGGEPPAQPPQSTSASRRCCAPGPRTGRPPALPSQTLFLTPCSPPSRHPDTVGWDKSFLPVSAPSLPTPQARSKPRWVCVEGRRAHRDPLGARMSRGCQRRLCTQGGPSRRGARPGDGHYHPGYFPDTMSTTSLHALRSCRQRQG